MGPADKKGKQQYNPRLFYIIRNFKNLPKAVYNRPTWYSQAPKLYNKFLRMRVENYAGGKILSFFLT